MVEQFNRAANNGGAVLISTLQTISNHMDFLKKEFVGDTLIDSVIIDEAHKIKNAKSKCHMQIAQLPSKSRFALTGTPIMNRLNELYSLFSWMFEVSFQVLFIHYYWATNETGQTTWYS